MKKIIPLALLILSAFQAFSQDKEPKPENPPITNNLNPNDIQSIKKILPPNPDAASLGKYGDVPISLYTGIPNIEIPLYQINRAVSVPITLSYHASGVKVDEIASMVGLSWVLNAGGVITRSVHGIPDDLSNGLQTTQGRNKFNQYRLQLVTGTAMTEIEQRSYETGVINGEYDTEPDEYFYNFLGRSGKMMFDENRAVYLLNHEKLKVSKNSSGFEIIDEQGTKYSFTEIETSKNFAYCFGKTPNYTAETAWYLSSITPINGRSITFSYITRDIASYTQGLNQTNRYKTNVGECLTEVQAPCQSVYNAAVKQLEYIYFDLGTIHFSYEQRADLGNGSNFYRLKELEVKNISDLLIKKITFTYTYNSYVDRFVLQEVNDITDANIAAIKYKMEYYHFNNLPPRNSNTQDHWGYYNNNTAGTMIPPMPVNDFFTWADREPDAEKSKYGMLTKITYPTGGYTIFDYEAHDYGHERQNQALNLVKISGGVRINKISHTDGVSPEQIKRYEYRMSNNPSRSSGTLIGIPFYHYSFKNIKQTHECDYIVATSSSQAALGTTQGSHIGYEEVTEYQEQGTALNGKTWHKFSSYSDFPDGGGYADIFPFAPVTSRDNARGQLKEKKVFRYSGGNFIEIQKTVNTYNYTDFAGIIGVKTMGHQFNETSSFYTNMSKEYEYKKIWTSLAETNEYTYDDNGNNEVHSRQTHQYSPTHLQIQETQTKQSLSNRTEIIRYTYPLDYNVSSGSLDANATAIKDMQDKNVVRNIIETRNIIKENSVEKLHNATLNTYYPSTTLAKESYSFISPAGESSWTNSSISNGNFQRDSRYSKDINIDQYDVYGNILQFTPKSGIVESYVWGYDSKLPIVKAVGVPYSSFTSINATPHLLSTDNDINNFGQQVRNISEDILVYTYESLRGLKKITSPAGINQNFEYDNLSRLKRIKDQDLNLTDWFNYNYATNSPGCITPNAPTITLTYNSLCSVTLTATGCSGTVSWSNGGGIGNAISVDTKNSTSYRATCTVAGCGSNPSSATTIPSLPNDWITQQIGTPPVNGCVQENGGLWTIRGTGNTFGASDNFNFVYKTHTDNAVIVAKITSMSAVGAGARAGLMIRSSSSPTADYFQVIYDRGAQAIGMFEQNSSNTDGYMGSHEPVYLGLWMRLKKNGNQVSTWYSNSANPAWNVDSDWTLLQTGNSNAFNNGFLLGITSYNNAYGSNSLVNETQFTNVSTYTF